MRGRDDLRCPDCGTALEVFAERPKHTDFTCPVARRGHELGKIGAGFKHAYWRCWEIPKELLEAMDGEE